MAAAQYIGVGNVARKVKNQYIGASGVARKVKNGYTGVGGVARKCYAGQDVIAISANGVTPDASGYLSYGRTIPSISKVTGRVRINDCCVTLYKSGVSIGEVEIDGWVPFTATGSTCTVDIKNKCYANFDDTGSISSAHLTLRFETGRFSGNINISYLYGDNERNQGAKLGSTGTVSYELNFTT